MTRTKQQTDKTREITLRRAAERQGLILSKSRRRDPRAQDYGTYGIADATTKSLIAGNPATGYGLSLDGVEDFLVAR